MEIIIDNKELALNIIKNFKKILKNSEEILEKQMIFLVKNNYKINEYKDKNDHIINQIQEPGNIFLNNNLYELSEIYWKNITRKTIEMSDKLGIRFNCGISLANTGVSQMAMGKAIEGLQNIYLAYENDKKTLNENKIGDIEVEETLLNSVLFYQFFQRLLKEYYKKISDSNLEILTFTETDFTEYPKKINPKDSVHLFFVLYELKNSLNLFNNNDDYISRGKTLMSLFSFCHWIEDKLRKAYSCQDLYSLMSIVFQNKLNKVVNFNMPITNENLRSETLEELHKKIEFNFKNEIDKDIANGRTIILLRNFTGHNYSAENHKFFSEVENYIIRILIIMMKILN